MKNMVWSNNPKAKPLAIACLIIGLQALALIAIAVIDAIALLRDSDETTNVSIGLIVTSVLVGAGLLALARAIATGQTWVRGILITLEVIAVFAGVSIATSGSSPVLFGLIVSVPAAAAVVCLVFPGVAEATTNPARRQGAYSQSDDGNQRPQ